VRRVEQRSQVFSHTLSGSRQPNAGEDISPRIYNSGSYFRSAEVQTKNKLGSHSASK